MKQLAVVLFLFFTATQIYAQDSLQLEWVKTFEMPDSEMDNAVDMVIDEEGYVYATGVRGGVWGGYEILTIKYSPEGEEEWLKIYKGKDSVWAEPVGIGLDEYGNVYVCGTELSSRAAGRYRSNYLIISYDKAGNKNWTANYTPTRWAEARSMEVDKEGNVFITGINFQDSTSAKREFLTVKFNSRGQIGWIQKYNESNISDDQAINVKVDNSGSVYINGYSQSPQITMTTLKYSEEGIVQWVRKKDSNQGLLLGIDHERNIFSGRSQIVKYNSQGEEIWTAMRDGVWLYSYFWDINFEKSGAIYLTGEVEYEDAFSRFTTLKFADNGEFVWESVIGKSGGEYGRSYSLAIDSSGNIYAGGTISSNEGDILIVKYSAEGEIQYEKRYNSPWNYEDYAQKILLDGKGNLYIWGVSYIDRSYQRACTLLKYSIQYITNFEEKINASDKNLHLYQNYPNPFNPNTQIEFNISKTDLITLTIFDLLGREVITLINEEKKPGSYTVKWNGKNNYENEVSSGVYFYQLKASSLSQVRKLIFIK